MKSSTFGLGLRDKKNNNNKAESFFLVKMSASEKKANMDTYDISSIKRVTREFLEVSRCCRAKQRQRNVQKSVLQVQNCFFFANLKSTYNPFFL